MAILDSPSPVLAAAAGHHARLRARLTQLAEGFIDAIDTYSSSAAVHHELVAFLRDELLPHVEMEDALLYTAARTDATSLLVRAMQDEHRMIEAIIKEVEKATTPVEAAIAVGALVVLCDVRIKQEDTHLLPALEATGIDLTELLKNHPEITGHASKHEST